MNVLITRPTMQAQGLAKEVQARGDVSICLPVIEIKPPHSSASMQAVMTDLAAFDLLIFVSPNTVTEFVKYTITIKSLPCVLAIGEGTANSLKQHHIDVTDYPKIANSNALLTLPNLQYIAGKKIVIFAGENGKTLLADTLKQRGADVSMAYTHRRCLPQYQLPFDWQVEQIDISVCTSLTSLHHFHAIIKRYKFDTLFSRALIVITRQMQTMARQLGFKSAVIIASDASNAAIIFALKQYEQQQATL